MFEFVICIQRRKILCFFHLNIYFRTWLLRSNAKYSRICGGYFPIRCGQQRQFRLHRLRQGRLQFRMKNPHILRRRLLHLLRGGRESGAAGRIARIGAGVGVRTGIIGDGGGCRGRGKGAGG